MLEQVIHMWRQCKAFKQMYSCDDRFRSLEYTFHNDGNEVSYVVEFEKIVETTDWPEHLSIPIAVVIDAEVICRVKQYLSIRNADALGLRVMFHNMDLVFTADVDFDGDFDEDV